MKVTLFKQDVSGAIRVWEGIGSIEGDKGLIEITYGQLCGAMQTQKEYIAEGKAGRTIKEQVMSRLASRVGNRRDQGYVNSLEEAKANKPTNQLNLAMPMLAKDFNGKIPESFFLQYKYNGNRCMITKQDGELIAYTRKGKRNNNLEHILKDIDIPEGTTLDGELYCHNTPLQTLRSWISRKQENTKKIKYMLYDTILEASYSKRLGAILAYNLGDNITIAKTRLLAKNSLASSDSIKSFLDSAIGLGYEGLIIRTDDTGYEAGKRSKSLLKVKKWHDEEFAVVDILSSADNWAVLVCQTDHGVFKVSAPGDMSFKKYVLQNKSQFIGKKVTVQYSELTNKKLPFHPTAIAFREDGE